MERNIKKFIIEMEEGQTMCHKCPFQAIDCTEEMYDVLDCGNYNLATMRIKELEEDNESKSFEKR